MMIWSKESLQNLSEKDLCLKVLIPLFRAMGYQDVRYYHGGVLEQGKDIVMWKHDELRGRIDYAVVVKAEKITGSASTVGVVAFQAQQALGSTFVDEHKHETHSVHEVLVVTSQEITKEGHEALLNSWGKTQVQQHITKIDGERLWELVEKYLPHESIFSSLSEASKVLNEIDSDYGYIVEIAPGKVHLIAIPKQEHVEPIPVSFDTKFPDTPEGREQEESFRRFIASGQQAQVKAEYITVKGLPDPLRSILQRSPEGTFFLGPQRSSKVFTATLLLKRENEEETILFPLVEFGTNYGGEEEVMLSNEQQPIPFKFHLRTPLTTKIASFSFDFTAAQSNAFSLLRSVEFSAALSKGGALILEDYETGQRFTLRPVDPNAIEPPGGNFIELLRKLVWIQQQLEITISLPKRELFSDDDVQNILSVEMILKRGQHPGSFSSVTVTLKPGVLQDILAQHPDGVLGAMRLVNDYHHDLLDNKVSLGPVELTSKGVRIDPEQLEELKKIEDSLDESPAIRLIPEEEQFDANFENWPKSSGNQRPEAESSESALDDEGSLPGGC